MPSTHRVIGSVPSTEERKKNWNKSWTGENSKVFALQALEPAESPKSHKMPEQQHGLVIAALGR